MDRFGRITIILMPFLVLGLVPLPSRAQQAGSADSPQSPQMAEPIVPAPRTRYVRSAQTARETRYTSATEPKVPPGSASDAGRRSSAGAQAAAATTRRPEFPHQPRPRPCGLPTLGRSSSPPRKSSAWVAEAKYEKAKVLWVPAFMMNACYYRHDGPGPDFSGGLTFRKGKMPSGNPLSAVLESPSTRTSTGSSPASPCTKSSP